VSRRPPPAEALREAFGSRLREQVDLSRYTSARTGGTADFFLEVRTAGDLKSAARRLWELEMPFRVLGGGSNVLVADEGVREVVILNEAKATRARETEAGPRLWAESGASLGGVARRAVERGWAGLEWAATVPGTVGGAVVGNAGAHGGDTAGCLESAEIAQQGAGDAEWPADRMEYAYRTSWLKRHPGEAVVAAATFRLTPSTSVDTNRRMQENIAYRQRTQPPGASWGSMFKNPPNDHAGRLIEAAGLKGHRVGQAEISPVHANFFVNLGRARAADVAELLTQARRRVAEASGVRLELEIELIGDWPETVRKDLA
jgi:UDP-N-acetylmuramate dehydrogenase